MMIYTYIKKDGDVKRIGAECDVPQALQDVMLPYSEAGWNLAEAAEYDEQVIKGGQAGMMVDPTLPTSGLVEEAPLTGDVAAVE